VRVTDVKLLAADEDLRAAHTLFRGAMHVKPADDEAWAFARTTFPRGRTFGGYVDGRLTGMTMSFPMPLAVPGGALLPCAAVTRVGVRVGSTRRGVLTAVMREQLTALAGAGEPLAALRASEYPIYGRFGYGVATRGVGLRFDPRRASAHPGAPAGGAVRVVEQSELSRVLPALYARMGAHRPGMFDRSADYWRIVVDNPLDDKFLTAVVHTGPDGDDGYVLYYPQENNSPEEPFGTAVQVQDLHAANPVAEAALWRFLMGIDLTNQVRAWQRPVDEVRRLRLLLADPRVASSGVEDDELWLRLVDVPAALAARSWAGSEPVLLGVRDAQLPGNAGTYRIAPDGVSRVEREPALECDVAVLARLYLGDVSASELAATGWLTVRDAAAVAAADALFGTSAVAWCGTFF
jgi:predicted acetyltransferase